jgi:hypothetical protein
VRPSVPLTRWPPALSWGLVIVAVCWTALFALRHHAHQPNVDDYLYTSTASNLGHAYGSSFASGVRATMHTGQTAPLVPLLASPLAAAWGVDGAVAVELPLLLMLTGGAYTLARRWASPTQAVVIAIAIALCPAVLGWSEMLNFAVATSAATVWALAAYVQSDGFRRSRWSLATGAAVGVLCLSRSLAPVYVAPLVAVIAIDLFRRIRRSAPARLLHAAVAALISIAIAAPWWVTSGPTALRYLRAAGYESSTGYNTGAPTPLAALNNRTRWTLQDMGYLDRVAVTLLVLAAAYVLARRWIRPGRDAQLVLGWSVLTFGILASSTNAGTGFGLPVLIVATVICGVAVSRVKALRLPAAVLAGALSLAGVIGETAGGPIPVLSEPIYRDMVAQTGAPRHTNLDETNREVAALVSHASVELVRQDDVLNANGLGWIGRNDGIVLVPPVGEPTTSGFLSALNRADYVVTGRSNRLYDRFADELMIEQVLSRMGFREVADLSLGPTNSIRVWVRPGPNPSIVGRLAGAATPASRNLGAKGPDTAMP